MGRYDFLSKLEVVPEEEVSLNLKKSAKEIVNLIVKAINIKKFSAKVDLVGSFAKNTLIRGESYEVDIFVRFDDSENISARLEEVVKIVSKEMKINYEKIHGSRDYFRFLKDNLIFEVIPVKNIKKQSEAENITDLTFAHVKYVQKKMNSKIRREIIIAKSFLKAQKIYGAESYVQGFSGYSVECLIIYYKTFLNMLKSLSKLDKQLILDPEKKYKNKRDILISLNESKVKSPVVLVDPTWKERNVLAALSDETFNKFKKIASSFLKKPDKSYFIVKEFDRSELENFAKNHDAEVVKLVLSTEKQPGDIAGTKLKKFANYLNDKFLEKYEIIRKEFLYFGNQEAEVYYVVKQKESFLILGPPIDMKKSVDKFKKEHKNIITKDGRLGYYCEKEKSVKEYIKKVLNKYQKVIDAISAKVIKID
ncbi:hypothetical protein COU54_01935 [Candidatus Pacearchaeota archaeon CG10_big_fil_rev_8_21_14_0_10_31_24]|nr:MAG: hypothetical protein COU54_01935 [Candidatus Pacearchaeota archaeon CG10_big_fil_rev_8_21_14_0_10_31_24]